MRENTEFKNYKIETIIGSDDLGVVYKAKVKNTDEKRAIKFIEKETIKAIYRTKFINEPSESDLQPYINYFKEEIKNNQKCEDKNENIVKYYEYFNTENEFVFVMELCDENLLNFITSKFEQLTMKEKYDIICQMNNTFKIMNNKNIKFNGLKPENILIKYENEEKTKYVVKLKLTDGNEKMSKIRKEINTNIKNNYLDSPEILNGENYNEKSDLWSLGVIIYILYYKDYPYKGVNDKAILNQINKGEQILKKSENNTNLNDLIKKLLKKTTKERLTWNQYFAHPFFKQEKKCKSYYTFDEKNDIIGNTDFATIYKAICNENKEQRAIKVYTKDKIKSYIKKRFNRNATDEDIKSYLNDFLNEIEHMKIIEGINRKNNNSVKYYEHFLDNDELSVVMELCDDNFGTFYASKKQPFDSQKIYEILNHLNNSFKIMSEKQLVHRSLNLENIFIKYKDKDKEKNKYVVKLKITEDSVLLKNLKNKNTFYKRDINNHYKAPEILNGDDYNEKCDLWSLGVIIYVLYFKDYPFAGDTDIQIYNNICNFKGNFKKTSDSILDDLIKKLLNKNIRERLTWEQYFNHSFFIPKEDCRKFYDIINKIAETNFAIIYKAKPKENNNELRAIKIYDKKKIENYLIKNKLDAKDEDIKLFFDKFKNEVRHMQIVEGKKKENNNTVKIYEFFEKENEFAVVMELCDDNLLEIFINDKLTFNSSEIYNMLNQLNNSFRIMSDKKLIHNALNLENILVKKLGKENFNYVYKLKLTEDSTLLDNEFKETKLGKIRGIPNYYAPEILRGESINEKADLWSLGIIIYDLYFKEFPFSGQGEMEVYKNIQKGQNFKNTTDKTLDDLIKKLLNKEKEERLNWEQYFNHPFFKQNQLIVNKNYYEIGDEIGNTHIATVYKAKIKETRELRAIKIYYKKKIKSHLKKLLRPLTDKEMKPYIDRINKEINHMEIIEGKNKQNNNTVKYYDFFEDDEEFCVVMELCDDNLLTVLSKMDRPFKLNMIYEILNQLNISFKIMSDNRLVHRALNLENILVKYLDKEKKKFIIKLKLTEDSCLLDDLQRNISYPNLINNQNYIAPEILNRDKYDEKCDLWSLGIIIYVLYFKEFPYKGETEFEILNNIKKGQIFKKTSDRSLDDLLKNLLNENIKERYNWNQYFKHSFFSNKKK